MIVPLHEFASCKFSASMKCGGQRVSMSRAFYATWYYRFGCVQLKILACVISILNQMNSENYMSLAFLITFSYC